MKKSNKLLLSAFLTVLFLIAAIHIALYAKYKAGHYTVYQREDQLKGIMQSFPGVSQVIIRNVHSANILFSDSAAVEKDRNDFIQYEQKGDSLVITGLDKYVVDLDNRHIVNITLPFNVNLSASNSFLYFEKGKKAAETNPVIYLQRSQAFFLDRNDPLQLGHIKLFASDSSIATFYGQTQIGHLEVQLSHSVLDYNNGHADSLSIMTDAASHISLRSELLLKSKITTIPGNP